MPSCAVKECGISEYHIKKNGSSIALHVFPKDKSRFMEWERFCGSNSRTGKRYVCSVHFEPSDFDNFYRVDLRRVLNKSGMYKSNYFLLLILISIHHFPAVPTIRIPQLAPLSNRSARAERKARKKLVEELIAAYDEEKTKKVNNSASVYRTILDESFRPSLNSTANNFDVLLEAISIAEESRVGTSGREGTPARNLTNTDKQRNNKLSSAVMRQIKNVMPLLEKMLAN